MGHENLVLLNCARPKKILLNSEKFYPKDQIEQKQWAICIDAQGQTVKGDKSGKFQNWPTSAENSKVLE